MSADKNTIIPRGPAPYLSSVFYGSASGDGSTLPLSVSVEMTNPSNSKRMKVTGFTIFRAFGTAVGTGMSPESIVEATLDGANLFGPSSMGIMTWIPNVPISSNLLCATSLGFNPAKPLELEPGESKTLTITFDISIAGDDVINSAFLEVNLIGNTAD